MSFQNQDNFVFEKILDEPAFQKPFLKKDLNIIYDDNGSGTYNTNQIRFSTELCANNGFYNNYSEGLVALPLIFALKSSNAAETYASFDLALALKNSHLNLIHSLSIDFNGTNLVQPIDYLNQYMIFLQHTTLSSEDEKLNGSLLGYAKDSSTSWGYSATASTQGQGLYNNSNPFIGVEAGSLNEGEIANKGLIRRQKYISRFSTNGKSVVLGGDVKKQNLNYVTAEGTNALVYYYTCYVRLSDLPFFKEMKMMRGGVFRINMTLNNNVQFQFRKNSVGTLEYVAGSYINNSGKTNPLMLCASMDVIKTHTNHSGGQAGEGVEQVNVKGSTVAEVYYPCGSSCIPSLGTTTYTVKMGIGNITVGNAVYTHELQKCRLYIPYYSFLGDAENTYLSTKEKVIDYLDVYRYEFDATGGASFGPRLITNGLARMKRLIMVGIMKSTGNGDLGLSASESPFTTEPATTSPFRISNFNCQVGNINLYANPITYSYEQFLLEMNGQQGVNANLTPGICSGRISLTDYNNNYHYIVVNLERRKPELENTLQSLQVQGTLDSPKEMTIYCFVEYYKTIVIDVETGIIKNTQL